MGSSSSKKARARRSLVLENFGLLASQTPFSVNDIESLYELYKKLSSSVIQDGYIRKEELQLALFRNSKKQNLFADRMFHLFDVKSNERIEFGEFIHSLSVFHPKTPDAVKTKYAFKLYDLRHTGYIEREELKEMVLALLNESDLNLSADVVETIVDKTFTEADLKGDGRIDEEEWEEYVAKNPSLLKNMTLPYLMDITTAFPSFEQLRRTRIITVDRFISVYAFLYSVKRWWKRQFSKLRSMKTAPVLSTWNCYPL